MAGSDSRTIVITGSTSGIGRAAALGLADAGARVVLAVRDASRGAELARMIAERTGDRERAVVVECDLARFASVRGAAERIASECDSIDVLCNNAGVIAARRELTEDGNELTFQVNHLSHHLLTSLLLPLLTAGTSRRVVTVSSDSHFYQYKGINLDDPGFERRWSPFRAYAHSKLANIMFAYELARRGKPHGVTSVAMHPGVVSTSFGREGWGVAGTLWNVFVPKLTPEQGADTLVFLAQASSGDVESGCYYFRRAPKRSSRPTYDTDAQRMLWDYSAGRVGLSPEIDLGRPVSPPVFAGERGRG